MRSTGPGVTSMVAAILLLTTGVPGAGGPAVPILGIEFEGNRALTDTDLKARLRVTREGGWYSPERLQLEIRMLTEFLHDQGFLRASVGPPSVELREAPPRGQGAVIRIPVSEGTRYTLGDLRVTSVQAFKPATLLQLSPLRSGQPYSRARMAEWKDKIEESYHTMGYARVELEIKEEIHPLKAVVDAVLECREGVAYRVSKITVVGDDSVDGAAFRKLLLVGEGGLYNPQMVSLSLQFLNTLRTYRPLSESDVEVKLDDARATAELVFRVAPMRRPSS
jgi:outer membrane protein insertion porin family